MQMIRINMKLTKKRQQILDTLKGSHSTLSAADIHAQLPDIDLATIYRNLELFTNERLIKQLRLGGGEALYEYQPEPHHHALCTECERVIHFTAPDDKIKKLLQLEDFDVDEIEVTVRGICDHNKK